MKHLGVFNCPILAADPGSAANGDIWYNSTTNKFRKRENSATSDWTALVPLFNSNTALQSLTVVANTPVYITSSNLNIPAGLVQGIITGTVFRWRISMSKSAAGTGVFNIIIYGGINGTTADTAMATQSVAPSQTAVADNMIVDVVLTWVTVGASGTAFWSITSLNDAASATGFGQVTGTAGFTGTTGAFNTTTASLKFGLGFTSTVGTPTVSIPMVTGEAFKLN